MKLAEIDLYNQDTYATIGVPHDQFELCRKEDPVHWQPEPKGRGFWALTKYDDLVFASKNPQVFSSWIGGGTVVEDADEIELSFIRTLIVNMDPPAHGKFRKLVNRGFTPRMIAYLESKIRSCAQKIVDKVAAQGRCDFVADLAVPMPLYMIAEMLGVPDKDWEKLFHWSNTLIAYDDPELGGSRENMTRAAMEIVRYCFELAASKQGSKDEDLSSILVNAHVDGEALTHQEFSSFVLLLSVAGNETTRNLMSGGVQLLIQNPKARDFLVRDPSLLPGAIEEMLRMVSPVTYMRRTLAQDFEMRGKLLKKGDKVAMYYCSANRDEEVFPDPHTFNIHRDPNPQVAFGIGEHFCLGANLARLEIRILWEEILKRIPDMEFAGQVRRLRSSYINGVKELQVKFTPESSSAQRAQVG